MAFFKKHFLTITVVPLLLLLIATAYFRFMVLQDYLVTYETDCDPETSVCFIGCEDDECEEEYYYALIERHAVEVKALCGTNVLECDDAFECQSGVEVCSIVYCDAENAIGDECEDINDTSI